VKETSMVRPPNPYGVTKIASEYYCSAIGALYDIEVAMLRIFNAYGPGQAVPPSHPPVIPHFVRQALTDGTVVIFGSGKQTRDFIYISDVVDALTTAGLTDSVNGLIINVGTGQEVSIDDLLRKIENLLGRKVSSLHNPSQSGGVTRLVAEISLARKVSEFEPRVSMDEGLRLMLSHYEKALQSNTSTRH
jgi:UDP-glucose 4-epimerase